MADLNPQQRQLVEQWAAEGATLNQIQDRLRTECSVTLTYMEVRLLIMELGVKIQDKPREKPPEPPAPPKQPPADVEDDIDIDADAQPPEGEATPPAGGGELKVSVDEIPPPGALVSGKATFSDGQTIQWFMDQQGRFGMRGPAPGYQPPPQDIPLFQRELDTLLSMRGF